MHRGAPRAYRDSAAGWVIRYTHLALISIGGGCSEQAETQQQPITKAKQKQRISSLQEDESRMRNTLVHREAITSYIFYNKIDRYGKFCDTGHIGYIIIGDQLTISNVFN